MTLITSLICLSPLFNLIHPARIEIEIMAFNHCENLLQAFFDITTCYEFLQRLKYRFYKLNYSYIFQNTDYQI